jgi:hypothetical protein
MSSVFSHPANESDLGSARASRAGDGAPAIADLIFGRPFQVRFGEAPKPAREARALPESLK